MEKSQHIEISSFRPKLVVLQEFLGRYPVLQFVNRIPDEPPVDDPHLKECTCAMVSEIALTLELCHLLAMKYFHHKTYSVLRELNIGDYKKWNEFRNWTIAARLLRERHIQLDHTAGA
jgi:hypothetical protein